ncbi:MAG: YeeE/YedE family protein [Neomegalonema sp.]|nr:YeeE/YedE family protein [Neomegalonema sp.]
MRAKIQYAPVVAAAIGLTALTWAAAGKTQIYAALLGALCGFALYHASFGFTGGWRRLVRERRGAGFRAQLLLLAMIVVISYPLIAYGGAMGIKVGAWVFPISLSSAIGAAVFGLGMQLGGGCGSGVLFTVGGGSSRMAITLFFFVLGSLLWVATNGAFQAGLNDAAQTIGLAQAPRMGGYSLIRSWGAPVALIATLAMLGLLAAFTWRLEKRAHGAIEAPGESGGALSGPWTKTQGALALAVASILTLLLIGRPWGITSAFTQWGAEFAQSVREIGAMMGVSAPKIPNVPDRLAAGSLFGNTTGVMDFGLMLGALAAAGLAGRYAPTWRLSFRDVWTAILGGVLMGYGARLAYGCNIGGFVGGIASGSLHGWWWLLFGWLGSWCGVWLRARIGVDPPRAAATA